MTQPTFDFDICEAHHGGVLESQEANAVVAPTKAAMQRLILVWLESVGDGTCDEAEAALGMKHQTCSARFTELHYAGLIVWIGEKRKTRSGCNAKVFRCSAGLE